MGRLSSRLVNKYKVTIMMKASTVCMLILLMAMSSNASNVSGFILDNAKHSKNVIGIYKLFFAPCEITCHGRQQNERYALSSGKKFLLATAFEQFGLPAYPLQAGYNLLECVQTCGKSEYDCNEQFRDDIALPCTEIWTRMFGEDEIDHRNEAVGRCEAVADLSKSVLMLFSCNVYSHFQEKACPCNWNEMKQ